MAVSRDALIGAEGGGLALAEEVVDYATVLLCAEAVGAMKYAHDATLEYLKTRRQFGVPIGSFQALQHRMVDILISCEQARSIACLAAVKIDTAEAAERRRVVSAAKIKIADAARHVSQEAVQLHGGMGMTEELKISHTFRRLTMIAQAFGDADHHLARFAAGRADAGLRAAQAPRRSGRSARAAVAPLDNAIRFERCGCLGGRSVAPIRSSESRGRGRGAGGRPARRCPAPPTRGRRRCGRRAGSGRGGWSRRSRWRRPALYMRSTAWSA